MCAIGSSFIRFFSFCSWLPIMFSMNYIALYFYIYLCLSFNCFSLFSPSLSLSLSYFLFSPNFLSISSFSLFLSHISLSPSIFSFSLFASPFFPLPLSLKCSLFLSLSLKCSLPPLTLFLCMSISLSFHISQMSTKYAEKFTYSKLHHNKSHTTISL